MWLFIILTQLLAAMTSIGLYWLLCPKRSISKIAIVVAVFAINNVVLIYGLSQFRGERFDVYLVVSILQGFVFYTGLITAFASLIYDQVLKRLIIQLKPIPKAIRALAISVYLGIVGLALFNAYSPVVHHLTVRMTKPLKRPMTIALVSDMHLSRWFGNRQLDKLADIIDMQDPEVVVIAGDIMNDSTLAYDKTNMQAHLSKLQAPLGVYATLGNHDYSGNQVAIAKAVESAGVEVIDNKSVLLNDAVWLVGRSDITDPKHASTQDLLAEIDIQKPVVFLEHSSWSVAEISDLSVDLHLSGHTHGGQIFPLPWIMQWTKPYFAPIVYGYEQIKKTQFLVTSGYGFGAVPFRLGTRSEIWIIKLESTI